jgi:hypothetical protein
VESGADDRRLPRPRVLGRTVKLQHTVTWRERHLQMQQTPMHQMAGRLGAETRQHYIDSVL